MIKLKNLLLEQNSDVFYMYHGGKRWEYTPSEIIPSAKGRYEAGVGIYLTNSYETARKYAKGSRVVHEIGVDKSYKDIRDIRIDVKELAESIKNIRGLQHKREIIQDIINYSNRVNRIDVPLNILNNLIVNYEAGSGNVGVEVTKFFVSKGADASLEEQSGNEQWLVIFNPKIIKSVTVVNPASISLNDYMLPRIERI